MSLTKTQRFKNYLEAVFGKHTLRTQKKKKFLSFFGKILTSQTCLYFKNELIPTTWVEFLDPRSKPRNTTQNRNKTNKDQTRGFC